MRSLLAIASNPVDAADVHGIGAGHRIASGKLKGLLIMDELIAYDAEMGPKASITRESVRALGRLPGSMLLASPSSHCIASGTRHVLHPA